MNKITDFFRKCFKNRLWKVGIASGAVLCLATVLVILGYYPVAVAGNRFVSAANLEKNYKAAMVYFAVLQKTYLSDADKNKLQGWDVKKAVLEQLLDNILIEREARRELGGELSNLVEKKIRELGRTQEMENLAYKLYGWNYADFKDEVLVPQAERDVLAAQLFLRGQNIEARLEEIKKSARVYVFLDGARWENGKLKD